MMAPSRENIWDVKFNLQIEYISTNGNAVCCTQQLHENTVGRISILSHITTIGNGGKELWAIWAWDKGGRRQSGDGSQKNKHFVKRAQLAGKRGREREKERRERHISHMWNVILAAEEWFCWGELHHNYSNTMLLLLCSNRQVEDSTKSVVMFCWSVR